MSIPKSPRARQALCSGKRSIVAPSTPAMIGNRVLCQNSASCATASETFAVTTRRCRSKTKMFAAPKEATTTWCSPRKCGAAIGDASPSSTSTLTRRLSVPATQLSIAAELLPASQSWWTGCSPPRPARTPVLLCARLRTLPRLQKQLMHCDCKPPLRPKERRSSKDYKLLTAP